MANWTAIILPGTFVVLLLVEQFIPLRQRTWPFFSRLVKNLTLTAFVFLVGSLIVKNAGLATSRWSAGRGIGIALWMPLPQWGRIAVGFLLMDLTFYYWHRANHQIRLLWRFHNVHHVDPDLDVTTSFRFHLGEIAYSSVFRVVQVALVGVAPLTYVIYETVFTIETMFHHSNVRLPFSFERLLNRIVVTPRMHGVHHSAVGPETNTNYSVIFPWWDYLHRTLVLNVPQSSIRIGVPGYLEPQDNKLWNLFSLPFVKQKRYWCYPDGKTPKSNKDASTDVTTMAK
jgi:sterol desaturase/sphingolipid hydroxylase (fatty acid hydroxylase superfamily)